METIQKDTVEDIFNTERTFADLGLDRAILDGLEKMGFEHPTKVQSELIPLALEGRDILAQSRTGTGKTAAFGLPILQRITPGRGFSAMVLCPTRELAIQVAHEMRNLGRFNKMKIVAVYGGQRMKVQAPKLEKRPEIIVGTPGRVMDFHRRGLIPYDEFQIAVLDEVDRMLDIGFRDDIRQILGTMKQEHQTIFVSATVSPEIERLANRYLNNPEKLVLAAGSLTVAQVDQSYFSVEPWDKNRLLVHLLKNRKPELSLVFCRTKQTVDGLADYLKRKGVEATGIHGDMYQGKRNRAMDKLRRGDIRVLVASDLAARGIDVEDITHVINYDLPEDPEVYVHRIGRTARTGRKGIAWSFVTPEQGELLTSIEKLANVEIRQGEAEDFEPGPVPERIAAARAADVARREETKETPKRTVVTPPTDDDAKNPSKYPGGLVPKEMPARRMGGRFKTRRSR